MARYNVDVGKEFTVIGAEVEDIAEVERLAFLAGRIRTERRHDRIINFILIIGVGALIASACVGVWDGDFDELETIWKIVAGPLGLALYPILRSKAGLFEDGQNTHKR